MIMFPSTKNPQTHCFKFEMNHPYHDNMSLSNMNKQLNIDFKSNIHLLMFHGVLIGDVTWNFCSI